MLLNILLLVLPAIIMASKSWYHWRYLKEVDHAYRSYGSSEELASKMLDHRKPAIGGIGMNSPQRLRYVMGAGHPWPFFVKRSAHKHSDLANLYIKVIYWHLVAFYLNVGILIALFTWG